MDQAATSAAVVDEVRRFLQEQPALVVVPDYTGLVTSGATEWYQTRYRCVSEERPGFVMSDSFAAFWTYDAISQREEHAHEAAFYQNQDSHIDPRPSVRQQLLIIWAQLDALLLQLNEEGDE